ncbi:hypothetical protein CASFOL_032850 [Castilleja foliolosa]|uniref:Uncharacterized protein n=1 Tax=Castilleja foliolosa TaxID=1961234 RepID=A0ABD3C3J0_9LAMI
MVICRKQGKCSTKCLRETRLAEMRFSMGMWNPETKYQCIRALWENAVKVSFTKTIQVLSPARGRVCTCTRKKSKTRKFAAPVSVSCSSSASPRDEEGSFLNSDWRTFRAKLVAKEQSFLPEKLISSVVDPDVDQLRPTTLGDKWAHTIHEPEKGCLLIATEKLDGVHIFERAVILLLSTGPIGPTGLILNRPSLMSIKEMRSSALDFSGAFSDRPLFFGGPLEDGLFLVSPNSENGVDGVGKSGVFEEVMKGLYYGTKESVGCAAEMVKRDVVQEGDFRFFDGYCAWEKDQLRDEMRAGYWTVAACSPSVVGLNSVGSVGLWEEVLGIMGPRKVW